MVMFSGAAGGDLVVDQRGADAVDLVRGDRHPDAAAFEKDGDLGVAPSDRAGSGSGEINVVAAGRAVATEILDLMTGALEHGQQLFLGVVPAMIGGDGDFHPKYSSSNQRLLLQALLDESLQL